MVATRPRVSVRRRSRRYPFERRGSNPIAGRDGNIDIVRRRHEGLFERADAAQERALPLGVEFREDVIEQEQRSLTRTRFEDPVFGDFEREYRRSLLPLGTERRQGYAAQPKGDIVAMWPDEARASRNLRDTFLREPSHESGGDSIARRDVDGDIGLVGDCEFAFAIADPRAMDGFRALVQGCDEGASREYEACPCCSSRAATKARRARMRRVPASTSRSS